MRYYYVLFIFITQFSYAQLGSECGIPAWNTTRGYPSNSYVFHNGNVYNNTIWSQEEEPGTPNSNWLNIGSCNEQLLLSYPDLAYTNCQNSTAWDSTTVNYSENDLILYSNGVYRVKYWVAGNEQPDISEAYEFLGICIIPIEITPEFSDNQVIIQNTLQALTIEANINTNGFTTIENKIRIKKTSEQNFTEFDMNLSNSTLTYNWTPYEYGDYNLQYYSKNSVGVETVENRTIKIAVSNPPNLALISPSMGSSFIQLNFSPIDISFSLSRTDYDISTIVFEDITANTTQNIPITTSIEYMFSWTPKNYGVNDLNIIVTDTQGTSESINFNFTIVDPTIENLSFENLPYQIKSVKGISKDFIFDKDIISVKSRDITLSTFSFSNTTLTVNSENTGRSGLEIVTSDNQKYYVGLRVDNEDGSVPKFPQHISIGSVSEDISDDVNFFNDGINDSELMLNNRMDVRYIYINGGPLIGWNTWQPDRAIKFARNSLKMGLIPIFIFYNIPDGGESYTTNLAHIQDPDYMTAYFENLELFLNQVEDVVDDEFFAVIFEPDFLGYMQQNSEPPTLSTSVGPNTIGAGAGTLKTLVERINYEINKKREDDNLNLEFGWQLNLWAKPNVAGIRGIIRETDNATTPSEFEAEIQKIRQTAIDIFEYGNTMGIMSSNADFISIDKYGLDALGYSNSSDPADPSSYTWFWNNDHWLNYYEFVDALHQESGKQVILWQIPVGHINESTTINQYTGTKFELLDNTSKHYEDSSSTFFFGDEVDFSNDDARFNYFSENKHGDPELIVNSANKHVTFGNHMAELNNIGVQLVLMGAGVGDSTDGIGDPNDPGATLTDDHFWIQKVQDYYINYLTSIAEPVTPEITINQPSTSDVYATYGTSVALGASVKLSFNDGNTTLSSIVFKLDGNVISTTDSGGIYSGTWTPADSDYGKTHTFTVEVESSNGETATESFDFMLNCSGSDCPSLANSDLEEKDNIVIYPNPTTDIITIKVNPQLNIKTIEVFDTLGKKVIETENINHIRLKSLNNGIYFMKIKTESQNVFVRKIIKKS